MGYGIKIEVSYVIFERLRPLLKPRLGECLLWGLDSYEYTLPSGEAIHFEVDHRNRKCWVHLDKRSPLIDPLGHLIEDAPHWLVILTSLVVGGILTGIAVFTKKNRS